MRLNEIKLAGFKSFVDPTTVRFSGQIGAIVGPNGCGKSNIIDAVKWVMGESSAKNLRGESMTDVIFNGSTQRQPVGQASIELVFDNSEGKLGGEYAKYQQISIKRVVTRDAQSNYYLNGARCRRRDITDLFLGTGLGPRSYAIIMQNTISRLIEAKPEELRIFLEEAAGISKYKERRRETELRIKHTRENLERLNDIRAELDKQLQHLQRQANAAEKYKVLKQDERLLHAQLQVLHWLGFDQQMQGLRQDSEQVENQLQQGIAAIRALDAEAERDREQHSAATEHFNDVQGNFYSIGAEIARIEQSKQHQQERKYSLQEDYDRASAAVRQAEEQLEADREKLTSLTEELQSAEPALADKQTQAEQAAQELASAEAEVNDWQQHWDEFNQLAAKNLQQAEVEQTRIRHHESQINDLKTRTDKLAEEKSNIDFNKFDEEIDAISKHHTELVTAKEAILTKLNETQAALTQQKQTNHELTEQLHQSRADSQQTQGRFASLEALQQAALGQKDAASMQWLKQHQLDDKPRLGQQLSIEQGWEHALETVLGSCLEAVCIDDLATIADDITGLEQGHLAFITVKDAATATANAVTQVSAKPLASLLKQKHHGLHWLNYVYIAEDIPQALELTSKLAAHESVITQSGIWFGPNWLRISKEKDSKAGVLQRQQELAQLTERLDQLKQTIQEQEDLLLQGREQLAELEQKREQLQDEINTHSSQLADCNAKLQVKQAEKRRQQQRLEQIEAELNNAEQDLARFQSELAQSREHWQKAMQQAEQDSDQREQMLQQRETTRERLLQLRQAARETKDAVHQLKLRYETAKTQRAALVDSIDRIESQLAQLHGQQSAVYDALTNTTAPIAELEQQLADALNKQSQVEKTLNEAKLAVEGFDQHMRELNHKRQRSEQDVQRSRERSEQIKMQINGIEVRRQTIEEAMQETEYTIEAVQQELPQEAKIETWEQELETVRRRIERLGAINLAAIDEFKTLSERKEYLDSQNTDLEDALQTLENAIRKIDNETKTRFKETYDQLNNNFKTLFPKVFGGGSAFLELTGDDLLETGVTVLARPPGKRNSTIHLLSGGEKALTALALVFSLFQLNPAPFCMLDEVDAPLDDANIGRFCTLVKEMSQTVQFVFISHNKLAIEMADQLLGVTMREPGVSRMVAVDIDQAISMAEA